MPFTLVGYFQNQSSTTLVPVAALADQHVTVSGNFIRPPKPMSKIGALCALGALLTRARIVSPSLRARAPLEIQPLNLAVLPSSPTPIFDAFDSPIDLAATEDVSAEITNSGAENETVLMWLQDRPLRPSGGKYQTFRFTGTTTLVVNKWTAVALTPDSTLPAGTYEVGGMRAQSTNLQAARLIFPGYPWRPGCIGYGASGNIESFEFRQGALGPWGRFTNIALPQVECLANVADTAETIWMDIRKVG